MTPELLSIVTVLVIPYNCRDPTYKAVFAQLMAEYMKHPFRNEGRKRYPTLYSAIRGAALVSGAGGANSANVIFALGLVMVVSVC
jgi:hypothetical protein